VQTLVVTDRQLTYTGAQLRSLWIYDTFGLSGDALVAFTGPAKVPTEALVDHHDRRAGDFIAATSMLHLIIEHFDTSLICAVLRQRLLMSLICDQLRQHDVPDLTRRGDDLFSAQAKLSVSIATISPVSTLIHTGINIDSEGAPVEACGLQDFGIEPRQLARSIAEAYTSEMASVEAARCKVRGVP